MILFQKNRASDRLEYRISASGDSYSAFAGKCTAKNIVIPDAVDGLPVTELGRAAFKGHTKLKGIHLPDSLIKISDEAFFACSAIREIKIPEGVREIGERALPPELSELVLPEGLVSLGEGNIGISVREIKLPHGITALTPGMFFRCNSLRQIMLHREIKRIDEAAISFCPSLSITYAGTKSDWLMIPKATGWNICSAEINIYCLDGILRG